ncbi:MAG: hypothetical protein DMD76_04950 [Candidatus Rokuibacteriota bacterium]|nr:MAG: hypothetical protein DMD76_04950 [Candidatus Rokubacteria bacterium]
MTRTPEAARQRWVILAVIVLAQTVANVGPLGIPAIASLIRDDLGLTLTQAGSFLSVYYLGPVTMSFFAGMLADRWGTAKTLVLGQALIAGGLLAASTAGSYGVLLALLGIAGVGYGTLNPASTTAAMSWFPPRQRATVVGLKQVGLPFGGMLGAALMPALALRLGWRWAIAAGALAIVACAALCATVYRDPTGEAPLRRAAGQRGTVAEVLRSRDLWLVASATLVFAAMQTVWMALLAGHRLHGPGRGSMAPHAARARVRLLRHRLERRAAHPHGRARRAALGRHRGRARARHLLARRDARPARLRLVRDGGGRLSRPVDRPLARDAGGARSPRARPRARAILGACRNRGAPRLRRGATSGRGGWGAISGPPMY